MSLNPQRPPGQEPHIQAVATSAEAPGQSPEVHEGAMWFFWLVGLSVVNTVLLFLNMDIVFLFSLGITQILEVMAISLFGESGLFLSLIPSAFVLGYFTLMGFFALRGYVWAFVAGMLVYAGDALILMLFGDWLSVAVHAYVLFRLGQGMMACFQSR